MEHNCCGKQKVRRGLWSPEEDEKLIQHINSSTSGHGSWSSVPKITGLQRCGKSCRLRWINYLRPDLKRGSFSEQEERIIIDLHRVLGNRWAQIAKQMPGRTDNEVKNFWNSCIKKKLIAQGLDPNTHNLIIIPSLPPPASNIIEYNCSPSQIIHKPRTSSFFPTTDQHHPMLHDFQNPNWVWSTDHHRQLEQDYKAAGSLHAMKFGVSVVSSSQNSCPLVREIISENWKWGSSCLEELLMGTTEKGKANCEVVEFEKGSTMVATSGNNIHMDNGNSFGSCSNTDDHFDFGESTSVLCGMNYHPNPIMDQYGWS